MRPTTISVSSRRVRPSRSRIVNAPSAVETVASTIAPAAAAARVDGPPALPGRIRPTAWTTIPPATAPMTRIAWLARIPYQGCVSSSRRSSVERNATQAPAVGPPSTMAAPTNGRWNVSEAPPGARRTRSEPRIPYSSHSRRPPVGPPSTVPAGNPASMVGHGALVSEVTARRPVPRTMIPPV